MFAAADVSVIPLQFGALGIVAYIVYWFIRRMDRTDDIREREKTSKDAEVAGLEEKLDVLRKDNERQHREKHDALNKQTIAQGKLTLFKRAARDCTCGAMAPLNHYLDD